MTYKNHKVNIQVNGEEVELFSQESLNLRINNTVFDPVEILSKTSEYSFSFELPTSPKNCRIFGYANDLSVIGKFTREFGTVVYADGIEIFHGVLRLSSVTRDSFKCNLVSVKLNKVEDIFGDTMMNRLRWEVPFTGTDTLNDVNADLTTDYFFPLVCYGAFQKVPDYQQGDYKTYSDLHTIDNTNQWYWESFHPSFRLNELVRRCFAHKGYNVSGDIFDDDFAKQIYVSEHLKDKQDPTYNIGSDKLGNLSMEFYYQNAIPSVAPGKYLSIWSNKYVQDNEYPHESAGIHRGDEYFDYDKMYVFDIFSAAYGDEYKPGDTIHEFNWIKKPDNRYMWRGYDELDRGGRIVIPADGMYRIELEVDFDQTPVWNSVETPGNYVDTYVNRFNQSKYEWEYKTQQWEKNLTNFPVEVQLVRNEDDVEWIWGIDKKNQTIYPHESTGIKDGINGGRWNSSFSGTNTFFKPDLWKTVAYDPMVNSNFICGLSTRSRSDAWIKNGMSWNNQTTESNISRFNCNGYNKVEQTISGDKVTNTATTKTDYNKNTLAGATDTYFTVYNKSHMAGRTKGIVNLKKNDVLTLKMLNWAFVLMHHEETGEDMLNNMPARLRVKLNIKPWSPTVDKWTTISNIPNYSNPEKPFDTNLNLGNFLKADEKMSDFIQDYINSFNLNYTQDGKNVFLNKNVLNNDLNVNVIDLDHKVNSSSAEASRIEYPASMEVKYSIDDSEAGFYSSVPDTHINEDDWKDWADRGSDNIVLVDDETASDETVDLKHSYTWYQNFKFMGYGPVGAATFALPVIAKDENFIIQSEKAMQVDGLGLKQRWWFRMGTGTRPISLKLWNGQIVHAAIPRNKSLDNYKLNYKNEEGSLLRHFFNFMSNPDSNFVTVNVYLTPQEYIDMKNGAMVRFDDDLYYVSVISGYDPTGNNETELKLIKKV